MSLLKETKSGLSNQMNKTVFLGMVLKLVFKLIFWCGISVDVFITPTSDDVLSLGHRKVGLKLKKSNHFTSSYGLILLSKEPLTNEKNYIYNLTEVYDFIKYT